MLKNALQTLILCLGLTAATNTYAQNTTLSLDDGVFETMWSLTSPQAGPGDWIGVALDPPFEHPFAVTRATMHFLDTFCCPTATCNQSCADAGLADWDARYIAPANLTIDAGGLTPDLNSAIISQGIPNNASGVPFVGPGVDTRTAPTPASNWSHTPNQWVLPARTIFDFPGRVFYVTKYFNQDDFMFFAVDETTPLGAGGSSIFTNDSFATRASIWTIGDVGMRVDVEPISFLKLATSAPQASFHVAGATNVPMLSFRVRGGNASTTVQTVRVTATGTGNDATDVANVRLVVDLDQDGSVDTGEPTIATGSYATNNGSVLLAPGRVLPLGTTEEWLIVYDFTTAPTGGDTFEARIAQANHVASNLVPSAPYVSGTTGGTGGILSSPVTIAGRLSVGLGPNSAASAVVPAGAQDLATMQLRVTSTNEQFSVTSLSFTAAGTLNDVTQITSASLYRDTNSNGTYEAGVDTALQTAQTFTLDDGRITFDFPTTPVTIPASQSRDFIVVYDLAAGGTGGQTLRTIFATSADISATGVASGAVPPTGPRSLLGAPVIGNDQTIGGALTAALGAANPPAGTAQPSATDVPMLQLTFTAQAETVDLSTLTFTASGTGDETTHVSRVRLWLDTNANGSVDGADVAVGLPQTYATNNGIVTFLTAGESVPTSAARTYLVTYDFSNTPTGGETFSVRLVAASDVSALGSASGAPIAALGTFPLNGNVKTTLGGLSIAAGPENPPSVNLQPGATDVVVLQLAVAAQGENFAVSSLRLTAGGSMLDDAGVSAVRLYRDTVPFGVVDPTDLLLSTSSFPTDDGVALFSFSPALTVSSGANERWLVVYDLSLLSSPGQTFRASIAAATDLAAVGSLSGNATASGLPLSGNLHAIGGTLSVAVGPANPTGGSIAPNGTDTVMLQARLTAVLEPIAISSMTFRASGSGNDMTAIQNARLWVDTNGNGQVEPVGDVPLGTPQPFTANDGAVTFTFAARTIAAGASETWIVAYDLAGTAIAGETFALQLMANTDLTAVAPSGPIPRATGAPVVGATRTVLGALTFARGAMSPAPTTVARSATDVPVVQLAIRGDNEAFIVQRLGFVAAGSVDDLGDITGATLLVDADASGTRTTGDAVLAGPLAFSGDDGLATFDNLTLAIAAGATVNVLMVVDLAGTAVGGSTLRVNLPTSASVVATGFAGRNVADPSGLPVGSDTITIGGTLDVRLGLASPIARIVRRNEVGISALQLRLVADTEPTTVTALTLHASGTGHDANGLANVELYLDGDGDGRVGPGEPLLGTGTVVGDDGFVTFALNQSIQVGPAVHLLARVAMSGTPVGGETFRLGLDPTQDIVHASASGAVVVTGLGVNGALLTTGGGFEIMIGTNSSAGGTVNQSQQNAAVLQLALTAVNEACTVDGITLRALGSIHDGLDVADVRLVRDANDNGLVDFNDVDFGTPRTFPEDDGVVTFTGLGRMLGTNASENWLVVYSLSGQASNLETFSVRLEDNTDVNVSCAVSGPVVPTGAPIDSASFTIQEDGAMILSRGGQSPPALFIAEGTVRAAALQIRVASSVQPLTLDALTFSSSVSAGAPASILAGIDLFRDVNQDGVLDRNDTLVASGGAPDASGRVTFGTVALSVPPDEAQFLLATVDVAAGATPGVTFAIGIADNADVTARSAFGTPLVTGAPVVSRTMTVAGNLNIASGSAPTNRTVQNDETGIVALDLTVSATWETFRLRSLTLTSEGSMAPSVAVSSVTLISDDDDDGAVGGSDRRVAERITFPEGRTRTVIAGLDEAVEPGTPRRFLVLLDLDGVATIDEAIALSIAANVDVLAEGDSVGLSSPVGAPVVGPTLTVGGSLVLSLGPASPPDTIVAANAEAVTVLQLNASASNEDVTLSRLSLSASGSLEDTSGIDDVHLFLDADQNGRIDPGDIEVAPAARVAGDDGKVTFGPIAERITKNTNVAFLVAIDLSGAGEAGQEVTFELATDADVSAFGALSGAVAASGAPIVGARVSLVGALNVRIHPSSPAGKGVRSEETFPAVAVEFFTQGEMVTLDQLALSFSGTADDAAVVSMVRLYVDVDQDGIVGDADQLLANGPVDGDDGRAVMASLNVTIPADGAASLLAEIEVAADAPTGGTLRVAVQTNDDVRATGATTGDITTVGAPVVGSSFTIVPPPRKPPAPAGEDGCSCASARETPQSGPSLIWWGVLVVFVGRRVKFVRSRH